MPIEKAVGKLLEKFDLDKFVSTDGGKMAINKKVVQDSVLRLINLQRIPNEVHPNIDAPSWMIRENLNRRNAHEIVRLLEDYIKNLDVWFENTEGGSQERTYAREAKKFIQKNLLSKLNDYRDILGKLKLTKNINIIQAEKIGHEAKQCLEEIKNICDQFYKNHSNFTAEALNKQIDTAHENLGKLVQTTITKKITDTETAYAELKEQRDQKIQKLQEQNKVIDAQKESCKQQTPGKQGNDLADLIAQITVYDWAQKNLQNTIKKLSEEKDDTDLHDLLQPFNKGVLTKQIDEGVASLSAIYQMVAKSKIPARTEIVVTELKPLIIDAFNLKQSVKAMGVIVKKVKESVDEEVEKAHRKLSGDAHKNTCTLVDFAKSLIAPIDKMLAVVVGDATKLNFAGLGMQETKTKNGKQINRVAIREKMKLNSTRDIKAEWKILDKEYNNAIKLVDKVFGALVKFQGARYEYSDIKYLKSVGKPAYNFSQKTFDFVRERLDGIDQADWGGGEKQDVAKRLDELKLNLSKAHDELSKTWNKEDKQQEFLTSARELRQVVEKVEKIYRFVAQRLREYTKEFNDILKQWQIDYEERRKLEVKFESVKKAVIKFKFKDYVEKLENTKKKLEKSVFYKKLDQIKVNTEYGTYLADIEEKIRSKLGTHNDAGTEFKDVFCQYQSEVVDHSTNSPKDLTDAIGLGRDFLNTAQESKKIMDDGIKNLEKEVFKKAKQESRSAARNP